MDPLSRLLQHKLVAILRGVAPTDVWSVAAALQDGGIHALELTLNSEDALAQISSLNNTFGDGMLIGAGTVLDVADAERAVQAGARFLISPVVGVDVIRFANDHNVVSIPGAYTATEIMQAHKAGGHIIKVFPVSDPSYIKALLAPLNKIRVMPTGGVSLTNIKAFSEAGAVAFGIGSSLLQYKGHADAAYLAGLTDRARCFVQAIAAGH